MHNEDFLRLRDDMETAILTGASAVAVLGLTHTTLRLLDTLTGAGLIDAVDGVYVAQENITRTALGAIPVCSLRDLASSQPDVVVVAADIEKEDLLLAALPYIQGVPKVIVAGYGHFRFRDPVYEGVLGQLLVPSLANGYPLCLVHLYQCLQNAAKLGLQGVVAEIGMFKGGTTMFLSRIIERLGTDWPVLGFDTFAGFPPRRSPLDMYDHPDCVFTDLPAVRRYLEGQQVEIIPGDIVETRQRLASEDLVLTFIDTDNYTSARAVLEIARDRTVINGAIVFDHVAGEGRFRYTLGERIAAMELLLDTRYFHLHGTGVFYRQR